MIETLLVREIGTRFHQVSKNPRNARVGLHRFGIKGLDKSLPSYQTYVEAGKGILAMFTEHSDSKYTLKCLLTAAEVAHAGRIAWSLSHVGVLLKEDELTKNVLSQIWKLWRDFDDTAHYVADKVCGIVVENITNSNVLEEEKVDV